ANLGNTLDPRNFVRINVGNALEITGSGVFNPPIYANGYLAGGVSTIRVLPSVQATWAGQIYNDINPTLPFQSVIEIKGGGVFAPTSSSAALGSGGQGGITGGYIVTGGSTLLIVNERGFGATAAVLTLGDATTNGILKFDADLSSPRNVTLASGGGGIGSNGHTVTLSGVVSGAGALSKLDNGTLILTGTNTYSGGTIVTGGILRLGTGGTVGSGPVTVAGGTFDTGGQSLNGSNLTGTGGTINFGAGGIVFNPTGNQTMGSNLTGNGGLVKTGSGTLILSGNNSFTGGITIAGGTVSLGSSNAAGTGAITTTGSVIDYANGINVANAIVINSNTTQLQTLAGVIATQTGVISQAGGVRPLEKIGTGTLILAGTNTYIGATSVTGGTLRVNGSIGGSAVTIVSGATLGGTGTVGSATVQAGGTLSPGNSIGTLNVNGNLTFAANSVYTVEVSPTAADLTVVSGTASLNGTLALTPAAGVYTGGANLTLLTASNISGTFANVTGLSFANLRSEIIYGATSVRLVLTPLAINFVGLSNNQISVATAINAGPLGNALQMALSDYVRANPSQMEAVLDSISGEIHASLRSAALQDSRLIRNTVQGQLARKPQGTSVWGQAFADYGSQDSDGNAAQAHRNNAGFIAGVDTQVAEGLRLGVGGAFMEHKLALNARASRATGARGSLLAYVSYTSDAFTLNFGGDYGWGSDDVSRTVTALGETQVSTRDSDAGGFFARASYDLGLPVLPYAGITHASATNGAFAETGGLAALSGGAVSDSQTYSLLGFGAVLGALDF
ncbi:MAG: autotransporter domain-containing protein, partial [Pseudomonadota bacterium]